jgi:hypothetical protein
MAYLTPYQIADRASGLEGTANIAMINRLFARQDDSNLWPINGRFNVTQRAIRRLRRLRAEVEINPGLEYALALDDEIGRIVNGED